MATIRPDTTRKPKAGDQAAAKVRQLEAFAPTPALPTSLVANSVTTNQGAPVADNHHSLKAGPRGPLLAEDFLLHEKLAHFGRERNPERVVFARGAGAHGYFELTKSLVEYTRADFLGELGLRTPVFVRFSNLAGERGSADTVRDTRGFAVKFYTREGNFDLVGQSLPVAWVQDAMNFPDLAHALKPEPHTGMPQASSAHDTLWDFASLLPETTHHLMWLMSSHALPRSLRMMNGYGVHSFRLIDARGASSTVKFHWRPKLGRHAMDAQEARRLAGDDPDFLRRDLWEAIEGNRLPEWELGLQIVSDTAAESLGVDPLDPTKLIPEESVPVQVVGRLVLNRNPDNHFAEVEQVAFHPGHVVPGIGFTRDPLLQGRLMAYTGAQMARLGGPNLHEIPINRPLCPFHNFTRGGAPRQTIDAGAVSYEPHSLATGNDFRLDGGRVADVAVSTIDSATGGKQPALSFDDHFTQAAMFWNSQPPAERERIVQAFRYELSKVRAPAVRQRMVDNLAHVDAKLARKVAEMLGIAAPDAKAAAGRAGFRGQRTEHGPEVSAALGGEASPAPVAGRRVAIVVADGVEVGAVKIIQQQLAQNDVETRVVAARLGPVATSSGQQLVADHTFQSMPSTAFDAVLVPSGAQSARLLADDGDAVRFVLEAWRHGKPMCLIGEASELLRGVDVEAALAAPDRSGLVVGSNEATGRIPMAQEFLAAMARHRHWSRTDVEKVAA